MNVTKVQTTPSFQGLNYKDNLPEIIKTTVKNSQALAKFGKKYNADVDYIYLQGSKKQSHPALIISNIVPKGMQKLIDKIKGVDGKGQFMYISTMVRENKTYTKNLYLPQMITFLTNTEMHLKQNK